MKPRILTQSRKLLRAATIAPTAPKPKKLQLDTLEGRDHPGQVVSGLGLLFGGSLLEPHLALASIVRDGVLPRANANNPQQPTAVVTPTPTHRPLELPAISLRAETPREAGQPTMPLFSEWFRRDAAEFDFGANTERSNFPSLRPNSQGNGGGSGGSAGGDARTPNITQPNREQPGASSPRETPADQSFRPDAPLATPRTTGNGSTTGSGAAGASAARNSNLTASNELTLEALQPTHEDAGGVGGFRVWRAGTDGDITVNYAVRGTAQAGVHYEQLSGQVTIRDGNRSAPIELNPLRFDPAAGQRTVRVRLQTGTGYTLGDNTNKTVTLGAFAANPVVTVVANNPAASDVSNPKPGEFTFFRTTLAGDLKVDYTLAGTATSGEDYLPMRGQVVIPAGNDWVKVRLQPTADQVGEGAESIVLTLESSTRYALGEATQATVYINDGGSGTSAQRGGGGVIALTDPPTDPPILITKTIPPLCAIMCECGCVANQNTPVLHGVLDFIGGARQKLVNYLFSANPVKYGYGEVRLGSVDLVSEGFGLNWGPARPWSNLDGYDQGSFLGKGWATEQTPHLVENGMSGTVSVLFNANTSFFFDVAGPNYTPAFAGPETLDHDATNKVFTFNDSTGNQIEFFDFDTSYPADKRGTFSKITDPSGNVTEAISWDTDGRITEVQRSRTVSSVTTIESLLTTYVASGTNAGLQETVTLRRKVGAGSWTTVRSVDYTYYDGTGSNGPANTLERAVVKDASSNVLNTDYYRYYMSNTSPGFTNGLKYFVGGEQYAQLEADLGGASNVDSASDGTIAPYANNYFEYQSDHRVTKEIASGAGCSSCSGGQGEFLYSYTDNMVMVDPNYWATKTVVTHPDGNEDIVYTNAIGAMMLKAYKDTTTNDIWATYYRYDNDGREILRAEPSAVNGWNDTYGDLVNMTFGSSSYLNDAEGLITTRTYASSTTATTSTPGDVETFFKEAGIQYGEAGTSVLQQSATYIEHSAGGVTIYPTAEETVYRNTNGTGALTTTHAYTFFSGTNQIEQHTITRPATTTTQNGSNSADADIVVNDAEGRPIWVKDAAGFITYVEYDQKTGATTKTIQDVDTTQTTTFANLPSGWSTPGGAGLHLTTTMEVDDLGRTTKLTDANGNITYTVFDDDAHEVRVYPGWDSTGGVPTGPTIVMREDRARGYRETLTMSATPNVSSSRPTGTESISSIQSLSREVLNEAGQVLYQDAYFDLTSISYSQSSVTLGTSGTNYYRTTLAYDKMGRHAKTVTPTGTIYRDEFDGQGRLLSKWVGTDDVPTTGFWSTTNLTGTDMVQTWEGEYDFGGVGDGLLTEETSFPGGGAPNRVTEHSYDWRLRPIATKEGVEGSESTSVNRPITYVEYDNLNNVVVQEMYDGDTLSITTDSNTDGVPDRPSSSALRAKGTAEYDDQGRVFREKIFSVNPSSGSVSSDALTTNHWYNSRGLEMKTSQPGGLISKNEFDGAGRLLKNFLTDGGSDSGFGDADDVTSDNVLTQSEYGYDAVGNVILTTTRDRFHDETSTGALGTPSTGVNARVSYAANYYDKANRPTATVNVGTNGGSSYSRPGTVPSRSDTVLVADYAYNAAGQVETTTDPKGLVGKQYYDLLGRTTKTIENYVNGTPSDTDDKTVEYTYNGTGQMTTLKALLTSGYQTTEWVYGITSPIVSNDIVKEMRYPDSSSGNASSGEKDSYTYNQLGEALTKTDRNGNTHTYSRDIVGRQTADAVTTLGSGVDGAVRRIETSYNTQGLIDQITSYDAASSGSIVNQIERGYNGLGQMTVEYQAVNGAVNTSTSPKVQYGYSEMASSANHSRLDTITYPNGRVLTYDYASGLASDISRLSSISDGATTLEGYAYLGLNTVVQRTQGSGIVLDYTADYRHTVGANFPTTAINNSATGDEAWNQEGKARESDDLYGIVGLIKDGDTSQLLEVTDFGFSLPSGATIEGIEAAIERVDASGNPASRVGDNVVQLLLNGSTVGSNKAAVGYWPQTEAIATYGNATDTWSAGLTPTDVNDVDFGLRLQVINQDDVVSLASVDSISLTVTYTQTGDAGDQYTGLDRFGRIVDQAWLDSTGTAVDRFAYGYDRDSNRLYKENLLSVTNSELYAYDGLNQLTSFERGTLNGPKTALTGAATRSQAWDFDALGNFDSQTTNGTAQTRSHNKQNEITSVSSATTPAYDANGSLTTDETGQTYKHDAWNRQVEVKTSGGSTIATFEYDGATRRIQEVRSGTTTDLYYSSQWQVLEERVAGTTRLSYAWSPVYVDAMIARDRDSDNNGSLDERLYVLHDANFNVTALADASGNVVERYQYDPFGTPTYFDASFSTRGSSSYALKYLHQGGRWDADIGQYIFRHRLLRPTLGRWTTMDPIGFSGGDLNLVRYLHGNVTTNLDPLGTLVITRDRDGRIYIEEIEEGDSEGGINECKRLFREAMNLLDSRRRRMSEAEYLIQ